MREDPMNGELLDLVLGELEPERESRIRRQLRDSAALRSELAEIEAIFGFMRRGEQIEVDRSVRQHVMAEARRMTAPSLAQRLRAIPALVRYRFAHSRGFRVAAISVGAHLVLMLVLYQFVIRTDTSRDVTEFQFGQVDSPEPEIRPAAEFVQRLTYARVSRTIRLRKFGVEGQRSAIRQGIEALLLRQREDGSFGDLEETSRAALVLLAENVNSCDMTQRGQALHRAMRNIRTQVDGGGQSKFALSALVEDWALNYADLTEPDRARTVMGIRTLLNRRGNGSEGLRSAAAAGFRDDVSEAIDDRVGHAREAALEAFRANLNRGATGDSAAILTLQSPYRF